MASVAAAVGPEDMQPVPRRAVLLAVGTAVAGAGCLGDPGSDGPRAHTVSLTLTRADGSVEASVESGGPVSDVVQVNVGDSVTFTVRNDADVPVGVHNHADDAEVVVDPGGETDLSFEATEAMTGRHEVEGWLAEDGEAGEHGAGATTLVVIEVRPRGS